jgi:hypothetical protein
VRRGKEHMRTRGTKKQTGRSGGGHTGTEGATWRRKGGLGGVGGVGGGGAAHSDGIPRDTRLLNEALLLAAG